MTNIIKIIVKCCLYVITLHFIVTSFHGKFSFVECVPSAQQENELLLLDALGRKQINNNNNNIKNNNNNYNAIASSYEPHSIMDMLGRSKKCLF